jgi:hypothetical protein
MLLHDLEFLVEVLGLVCCKMSSHPNTAVVVLSARFELDGDEASEIEERLPGDKCRNELL